MDKTSILTKRRRKSWAPRLACGLLLFACWCGTDQQVSSANDLRIEAGSRQLSVYPEYAASFDADSNPIDVDLTDPTTNDPSYIHQIDIFAEVTGLAAGEDVAGIAFNINLGSGLSMPENLYGWKAYLPGVSNDLASLANSGTVEIPSWFYNGDYFTNVDAGGNSQDLNAILILPGSRTAMIGQFGEIDNDGGQRLKLGSVYVQWDGISGSSIQTASVSGDWLLWTENENGNGNMKTLPGALYSQSPQTTVTFGEGEVIETPRISAVPEPSALILAVLGMALSLTRRRRLFQF